MYMPYINIKVKHWFDYIMMHLNNYVIIIICIVLCKYLILNRIQ